MVQGNWKRLNTLQHYKAGRTDPPRGLAAALFHSNQVLCHQVPEGATVALVARHTKLIHHDNHDYMAGESEYRKKDIL